MRTRENSLGVEFEVLEADAAYVLGVFSVLTHGLDFLPLRSRERRWRSTNDSQPLSERQFLFVFVGSHSLAILLFKALDVLGLVWEDGVWLGIDRFRARLF